MSPTRPSPDAGGIAEIQLQQQSGNSTLTCQQILSPPLCKLGEGSDALVYQNLQPAWQCSFSKDGKWLAACFGAPGPCIRVWRYVDDGEEWQLDATLQGIHTRTIRSVAFAPILKPLTLASASFDGTVGIWEFNEQFKTTPDHWECTAQLEGHDNEVKAVAWNATGSLLGTCGRDKSVWIWECYLPGTVGGPNTNDGGDFECIAVLNGHEGDVKTIHFAPSHGQWGDGDEILLSASYDDTIKCWAEDAGDWYCAASIAGVHCSTIWSIAISPSGIRMVSGSADGSLAIYKCYTATEKKEKFPSESQNSNGLWKCVGKLPEAHQSSVYSVHYASARAGHGRIVSCGGDRRIQIYKEARGSTSDQPLFLLDVRIEATLQGDINSVAWHPWDGSLLASAGDDGCVRLWKYQIM